MTASATTLDPGAAAPALPSDRAFLGHPKGLGWLAFCEFWERFSYYGMQALLVLYMTQYLLLPEHVGGVAGMDTLRRVLESVFGKLTPLGLASQVYGWYAGLVYLTPILGGLVADRVLGRTRTVVLGASLMALGHFLMAFEASFLLALACLLAGVGCFKGNIAAQVGDLYGPKDTRRASAFQIFMLAVQLAVILSPLVCGSLGEKVAWHWGFGAAGVGMVIGLFVYLAGRQWLPAETSRAAARADLASGRTQKRPPMTSAEKGRLALLVALVPVLSMSIVGNQQIFNAYVVWSKAHIDLVFFGWEIPVTWLQAVDALISTFTMLATIAFWRWYSTKRREPAEIVKIAIGSFIAAGAPALLMIAAGLVEGSDRKLGFGWTLAFGVVNDFGFANILPVGLALYSRTAPRSLEGLMIGVYYLHLFIGNTFVGWLGGLLEKMSGAAFWGLHAMLVLGAAFALLAVRLVFGRLLATADREPEEPADR